MLSQQGLAILFFWVFFFTGGALCWFPAKCFRVTNCKDRTPPAAKDSIRFYDVMI